MTQDFGFNTKDLEGLDPETRDSVIQARAMARDIRASLDPSNITGWVDLFNKLKFALWSVGQKIEIEKILNPPR